VSARGEKQLVKLLVEEEAVAFLSRRGLNLALVPTPPLREVVDWALRYYRVGGTAPSADALKERFGDLLSDHEIDVSVAAEDTAQWAVEDLEGSYVRACGMSFSKRMATAISDAPQEERVDVLAACAAELAALSVSLQPRHSRVDLREAGLGMLADYDRLATSDDKVRGMAFGLPSVDAYTRGIWPGELAVVAAPPKGYKSYFLDYVAMEEWKRGRPTALVTLENSIEMTQLRIASLALKLSIEDLQDGTLPESEHRLLVEWVNDVLVKSDTPLHILHPDLPLRTPQALIQQVRGLEAQSLVLDQLTFVESGQDKRNQSRAYELRDIMHDLATAISTGREPISCLAAHQLNRDGIKEAEKTGQLRAQAMSDSSEVEKTATWVFGLYASEHQRVLRQVTLQTLATRRGKRRDFNLTLDASVGLIQELGAAP
jgi:replicative DNA helicase